MRSVVWGSGPSVRLVCEQLKSPRLSSELVMTSSREEFLAACDSKSLGFVGDEHLDALEGAPVTRPTIVVTDQALVDLVPWLGVHPWMNQAISGAFLEHQRAGEHLDHVIQTNLATGRPRLLDWVGTDVGGRRVRLVHASRRAERIERMDEFFTTKGVGDRTKQHLRDIAEELLTNAFYDAPAAAGAFSRPVSRAEDVTLPDDCACDLAYGARKEFAFVRVKDVFGSLSRRRVVEVLGRCARRDMKVEVDETMGGAGLGLWRIFSIATFVGVSVVKDRYTEIVVAIAKKNVGATRPFAFHMFFKDSVKRRLWGLLDTETSQVTVNKSVIIDAKSK